MLSFIVCMIVDRTNFVVETLLKNTSIVPRALSNSQLKEKILERGKCSCVCLQQSKALCCDELNLLISTYGYM